MALWRRLGSLPFGGCVARFHGARISSLRCLSTTAYGETSECIARHHNNAPLTLYIQIVFKIAHYTLFSWYMYSGCIYPFILFNPSYMCMQLRCSSAKGFPYLLSLYPLERNNVNSLSVHIYKQLLTFRKT